MRDIVYVRQQAILVPMISGKPILNIAIGPKDIANHSSNRALGATCMSVSRIAC